MGLFNIYPLTSFHTILVLVFLLPFRAKVDFSLTSNFDFAL